MNSLSIKVEAMIEVHNIERIAKDAIELVNKLKVPIYLTFFDNAFNIYIFECSSEQEIIEEYNKNMKLYN